MILADLRVTAMRPSLEAIGRFNPERARTRFLSAYTADDTYLINIEAGLVGFYVLRDRGDHLFLDHLYLSPTLQGTGIGRSIVARIQEIGRPIRLMALRESAANAFYMRCGFEQVSVDTYDIHYFWMP